MQDAETREDRQVTRRMKWTREHNENVIRSYFKATLRFPDQPHRKEMYSNWKSIYPDTVLTEQRICDQKRVIFNRAENNNNAHGQWLTNMEINQIRDQIRMELTNEQPAQPHIQPQNDRDELAVAENNTRDQDEDLHQDEDPRTAEEAYDERHEIRRVLSEIYAETSITPFENRFTFRKPGKNIEKELKKSLAKLNEAIEDFPLLTEISDVNQLNDFTYACALLSVKNANLEKQCIVKQRNGNQKRKQDWQHNINLRINEIRADISKIDQMSSANPSPKIKRNNNSMKNKYNIRDEQCRIRTLETLKQRLMALNNRLRRFIRRENQYHHNNTFQNNPGKFYDEIRNDKINIDEPPTENDINSFWKPIFNNEQHYNKDTYWLNDYKNAVGEKIQEAEYQEVTKEEVKSATSKFQNWKSPGIDRLHNFWWCHLTNLHHKMADVLDHILNHPDQSPPWLTTGRTTLVPKKHETKNPANYRPITCLPIIYKILTNIITNRMKHHINANQIVPNEQKGCSNETYGTIDQLTINSMVMKDAKKNKRNVSTAWIDYKKAFDSIPHDWLIESLKIHKFDHVTINFFTNTIKNWRTSLNLHATNSENIVSEMFQIKNGIFQGDSPSGLHFVICLLPLTWLINSANIGYKPSFSKEKISHLMFMDDLKLYAPNDNQLTSLINIVKRFSDDIKMNFGIDKCNKLSIVRGKVKETGNTRLNNGEEIKALNNQQYYKYLGFKEKERISKTTKAELQTEYFARAKKVLKTELNSRNTINALNAYAIPALSYGFQIIDWSVTELEAIDRATRILLQKHHAMHNQSDMTRIYLPRAGGGRGLINITNHYKNTIINFSRYLQRTNEPLLQTASNWQFTRGEKSIHAKAAKYCQEIGLDYDQTQALSKQQLKDSVKKNRVRSMANQLCRKQLHGQYFRKLEENHIDTKTSNSWLKSSGLKRATESTICAIQEQAITTNYVKKHIHHTSEEDLCRVCRIAKETIHHITSGCTAMAPTKYLQRHNNLAKYIHILLLEKYGLTDENLKWYNHTPSDVIENAATKVLWDFPIQTDHEIHHNKPDIIVLRKNEKNATIIDIAVPNDANIATKRLEKLRNYTDLAVEMKMLWNLNKVDIVPIVIGATGVFHKEFARDTGKLGLNDKLNISICQKIVLLGTAHIVRAFMQIA